MKLSYKILGILVMALFAGAFMTGDASALYVEDILTNSGQIFGPGSFDFNMTYDGSEDPAAWATLEIYAFDVDGPDEHTVYFDGNNVGTLTVAGDSVVSYSLFNLDPSWLTGGGTYAVNVYVPSGWWIWVDEAILTVSGVPEPATLLLLGTGLAGLALARRRNAR